MLLYLNYFELTKIRARWPQQGQQRRAESAGQGKDQVTTPVVCSEFGWCSFGFALPDTVSYHLRYLQINMSLCWVCWSTERFWFLVYMIAGYWWRVKRLHSASALCMSALQAAHQQGEDLVENLAGTWGWFFLGGCLLFDWWDVQDSKACQGSQASGEDLNNKTLLLHTTWLPSFFFWEVPHGPPSVCFVQGKVADVRWGIVWKPSLERCFEARRFQRNIETHILHYKKG